MEKNKLNMFLFCPPISASALFLGCSYFSDHFEARCSYKVCSYKKRVYMRMAWKRIYPPPGASRKLQQIQKIN